MAMEYIGWVIHFIFSLLFGVIVGATVSIIRAGLHRTITIDDSWTASFIVGSFAPIVLAVDLIVAMRMRGPVEPSIRSTLVWYITFWVVSGVVLSYSAARWVLSGTPLTRRQRQ